jgi:hypothetical protein
VLPQPPQLRRSEVVLMHVVPPPNGEGQALKPAWQLHWPARQNSPKPHWLPHAPQF